MPKISTSEIRNGLTIDLDGELYTIDEFQHVKPGKGGAFIRTTLKGVVNDKTIEKTFRSGAKLHSVRVESHPYQFLYAEGNMYFFMHEETYEQVPLEEARIKKPEFIKEGGTCTLLIDMENEKVLYAEPPAQITAEIEKTEPGVRGDTAQGGTKPATLETEAVIQVPLFINEGDEVRVDTRTGEYIERVNTE